MNPTDLFDAFSNGKLNESELLHALRALPSGQALTGLMKGYQCGDIDAEQYEKFYEKLSLRDNTTHAGNTPVSNTYDRPPQEDATRVYSDATQRGITQHSIDQNSTIQEPAQSSTDHTTLPDAQHDHTNTALYSSPNDTLIDPDRTHQASNDQSAEIKPGTTIKGRFVLQGKLGRGGMGTVYKARDLRKVEALDKDSYVAIKFLNPEFRTNSQALIALQREAKKAQALAHPNIVTVFDFDREGDLVYLTMEYLEGQTLEQLISTHSSRGLPTAAAVDITTHIGRGLAYAHNQGFAHADLKPSNIFITDNSVVKLLDFGIAQAVRAAGVGDPWHDSKTVDDTRFDPYSLGAITPNYASPEMLANEKPTPADDIFSLGCVMYALLTGKHPFLDENGRKLTSALAQANGLQPKKIRGLSRRLQRVVQTSLQFDRALRYQNGVAFLTHIKPRNRFGKAAIALTSIATVSAAIAWWILAGQSEAAISMSDLPSSMDEFASTLQLGDASMEYGDIDQAHKLYAQAWEASFDTESMDPRDQHKLKVLVDRRIDKIIEIIIEESKKPALSEFRKPQLELTLESLRDSELGTLDDDITEALEDLNSN